MQLVHSASCSWSQRNGLSRHGVVDADDSHGSNFNTFLVLNKGLLPVG